jgi:phosphotriesterase-related protein
MSEVMVREIEVGIDGSGGVRCGVIGEIGCSYPLMDVEKRALQAAASAQTKTGEGGWVERELYTIACRGSNFELVPSGAPLIIHPGRDDRSPFEIVSILESAGASIDRTVMSHLDRSLQGEDKVLEFAKLGCIMEYDLFGMECSHYQVTYYVTILHV